MKINRILPFAFAGLLTTSIVPVLSATTQGAPAAQASTVSASASEAEISVDLSDRSLGKIYHGASGALYGLSEPNVPDINTLIPLKPSHILQKAPNGVQHPSGDALRVANYFSEAGGSNVQVYMQDYYGRWYYPSRTAEQYITEAVTPIAQNIKAYKDTWASKNLSQNLNEKFIYVPYNEPEQNTTRYPGMTVDDATGASSRATFNQDWLAVHRAIRAIDPGARISGPNLLKYQPLIVESFVSFCIKNDCLPDTFSWHLLSNKSYAQAKTGLDAYRTVEAANASAYAALYPDRKSPFPIPVDINEYASTAEIAVGGHLVQYIARYDELKVTGALPYWNTANSYGSLLAGENEPNGAWWLYKWYADMEGDMAKVDVVKSNADGDTFGDGLYGLSTVDNDKKQVGIVFGGTTGASQVVFNNVVGNNNSPTFLAHSPKVHISVWRAGFTGLTGFLAQPTRVIDGNFDVVHGSVTLPVETDNMASYYAVVTNAVDSVADTVWYHRYEAEDAEVRNNVQAVTSVYPRVVDSRTSASNGQFIGGIDNSDSLVKFTNVKVPKDGNYRLDIVEGSGSTASLPAQSGGGNTIQRQNSEFFAKIDNQPSFKVVLRADYSWTQLGMVTDYVDLKAGGHSISISKYNQDTGEMGQGAATLDAIELTSNGKLGAKPQYRVQAEFADYDQSKGLHREDSISGFEGAGYVTGSKSMAPDAKTRFVMDVQKDGMYDVTMRYATRGAGELIIGHDRKNVSNISVQGTDGKWRNTKLRMFLRTGINLIDVKSSATLSLDYLDVALVDEVPLFAIEAEDAAIVGTPAEGDPSLIRRDVFAKYASGEAYVNGITSYDGVDRYLKISNIHVKQAGRYKLVVHYANGQYSGTHAYNNNVVERYAQVSVNDATPETVYFKNTISWQEFATQTIDVQLKKGKNTIKFSNDNTYDGGANPYGGSNAAGTAPFVYTVMVPEQYAPAFDKFEIYELPSLVDKKVK